MGDEADLDMGVVEAERGEWDTCVKADLRRQVDIMPMVVDEETGESVVDQEKKKPAAVVLPVHRLLEGVWTLDLSEEEERVRPFLSGSVLKERLHPMVRRCVNFATLPRN